jgi:hypothetical protein
VAVEAPDEDDLLEPLPIYVDGVAIAPVYASSGSSPAASMHAHEIIEATPARVAQPLAVHTIQPSARSERPPESSAHIASFVCTFSRMIALRADLLGYLPDWWRHRARNELVEIAGRLFLEQPRCVRADTWRMPGSLHSPGHLRSIPFELLLWPRFDTWTKLRLEPQRGVRVGRRYFANGRHALDELCADLIQGLSACSGTGQDEHLHTVYL